MTAERDDLALWELADEILDAINVEDVNPPSLSETIADLVRPWLADHDRAVRAEVIDEARFPGYLARRDEAVRAEQAGRTRRLDAALTEVAMMLREEYPREQIAQFVAAIRAEGTDRGA